MNLCDQLIPNRETNVPEIGCNSPQEICHALELVIGDVNRFLQNFCDRLQRVVPANDSSSSHLDETDDLAEEQALWEAKRESVEQKIREQLDLLADAWMRLEAEQRSFLQKKEGLAFDLHSRAERSIADSSVGASLQSVPGGSRLPPRPQQSAVHEFERLRQEVQSSRPHNSVKRG